MTEDELAEWVEWLPILRSFEISPKDAEPDIKALARLLRNDKPLSSHVRHELAGLLEDRIFEGVRNWQLRPVYTGKHAACTREAKKERLLDEAMAAEPTVTDAIAQIDASGAMSGRTAWTTWTKRKAKRALLEEHAEETMRLVRRMLDRMAGGETVDVTQELKQIMDRLKPAPPRRGS